MSQVGGNRLLVLGGGLSGLSYVHYIRNFAAAQNKMHKLGKITVVEANDYMGGSVKSNVFDDGIVHELGPRSVRNVGFKAKNTALLIEQLGLADKVLGITSNAPAAKNKYVYLKGNLHILPITASKVFSKIPGGESRLISGILSDFKKGPMDLNSYPGRDPPIYDFVRYRFGEDIAEYISDPIMRGIAAGDVRELSSRAILGDMLLKEQEYGSVIRNGGKPSPVPKTKHDELFPIDYMKSKLLQKLETDKVISFNLSTGLQSLPEYISNSLLNTNDDGLISIFNQTRVKSIGLNESEAPAKVEVETIDGDLVDMYADHVVSTLPSKEFLKTLPEDMTVAQSLLLEKLAAVPHAPVACVVLEYRNITNKLPDAVNSFGFLTHSKAGCRVLGISFDSTMFPDIDKPHNSVRMTAMIGGSWFKEMVGTRDLDSVTNTQLEQIALEEVQRILGIMDTPVRMSTLLWKTGIAQYKPGHTDLIEEVRKGIKSMSLPLTLLGQSYDGIAINDVIFASRMAAYRYVQNL